jgi:predicted transcriptional regulator
MMDSSSETKLSHLFDSLLNYISEDKTIKLDDERKYTDIIFKILIKKDKNRSKLLANSSLFVDKTIASTLLDNGLVQISADGQEKYSLTFKGIAEVLRFKYNVAYDQQFSDYLKDIDNEYSAIDTSVFSWKDQLSTICFILVGATSVRSAVVLDIQENISLMTNVFENTLQILKKYKIVNEEAMLNTGVRGEAPVLFLINRLRDLSKRTNHYYQNPGKSVHYFEVEEAGHVSNQRVMFLLRKIFFKYDSTKDYAGLSQELQELSLKYSPGFINRKILQRNIFEINSILQEFIQDEIHRLPSGN